LSNASTIPGPNGDGSCSGSHPSPDQIHFPHPPASIPGFRSARTAFAVQMAHLPGQMACLPERIGRLPRRMACLKIHTVNLPFYMQRLNLISSRLPVHFTR
jgi:hypothetical protein